MYLVVVRDLNAGQRLTYAALALRLGKVFRDESPFTRLATPPPPAPGGGGRSGGGKSTAATVGTLTALGRRRHAPPVGEWKKPEGGGRYLVWEGTGMPCVTCWRLWAVTTGYRPHGHRRYLHLLVHRRVCTRASTISRPPSTRCSAAIVRMAAGCCTCPAGTFPAGAGAAAAARRGTGCHGYERPPARDAPPIAGLRSSSRDSVSGW
ncbi:hypothetical protein CYMTET_3740 [Cymbomonas tetramitiformis]|uniref:Uncharacterized protein n=1 Tax=Cymbomonas tetramitiformis TaxID=36881 RepID=A0AAE0H2M0_9CHLO|nr:hypothetical protein CYMTET_3740 [Cymbomonas tetramitiformis]